MPAKPSFLQNLTQKKRTDRQEPPVIYERITKRDVPLSPSAWTIFQDSLKSGLRYTEDTATTSQEREDSPRQSWFAGAGKKQISGEQHFQDLQARRTGLNIDIVWSGIALGCLLGAVYFFFGGLQPLILQSYLANVEAHIDKLGEVFVNQANALSAVQVAVVQSTSYNVLSDCRPEQRYANLEQDIAKIELAERTLFPNQELKTVPKFNGLAETESRQAYESLYTHYARSLQNLSNTGLKDLRDLPSYANYRNAWINACTVIINVNSSLPQILDSCRQLTLATEEYLGNHQPSFWSQIDTSVRTNLELCTKLQAGQVGNFIDWKFRWLSEYGKITAFVPDVSSNINKINSAIQDLKTESDKTRDKLDEIYTRKTSWIGMWYLLEF